MSHISSSAFSDTKAHYDLLDGLRGVAALMVIWYHIFEGYAFAGGSIIETFNHGYLAVDFFFILSGFVIGYAYDDRWGRNLTMKNFFKRRLIRLHPMVIMGAVLGAITFCLQGCVQWDGTHIALSMYNPQIQISAESETKRSIFREKDKTKRSKKESAQHSKSRNKSFVMTSVSAL